MIFHDEVRKENFQLSDALVLPEPLLLEAEGLLPVPASTGFRLHTPLFRGDHNVTAQQLKTLTAYITDRTDSAPAVLEGMLVLPLLTGDTEGLDLIVYNIDTAVLQKMGKEWLLELQENMLRRFSRIRQIYIDPDTGLYNRRALNQLLSSKSCWKSLFLVAVVPGTRTLAGGFQKIHQVASRLQILTEEPLFYFGQGLFGLVSRNSERNACLHFSHRLISRLKREGLRRVHVGFSLLHQEDSPEELLARCRLILSEAERRGPYSLCDEAFLNRKEEDPFALPPANTLRLLQRKWSGLDRFGLLLVEFPEKHLEAASQSEPPPDLSPMLPAPCSCLRLSHHGQLIFLPDYTADQINKQARELFQDIENSTGRRPSMGFCHWPFAGLSKADCIRSCRKAILHGSFYGEGAVVAFGALSYNVSGDLYFDEGDYKQAIREYRAGLQMKPDDINLLNSLGVALAEVNRHREALACFSRVLDDPAAPSPSMAYINKGMSCRVLGRNKEATVCFEQALDCGKHAKQTSNQVSIEVYLQLGKLYCIQEKFEKAVALLKEWRQLRGEPEEFIFFRLTGEACMGAGRNREAIKALQRSLQIYPQNSDSQSMLGLLYVQEGQGAEVGLSLCNRAVSADSTDARHLYRRGAALYHLGRFPEALDDVKASLRVKRNNEQSLLLRGTIYKKLGFGRRAKQSFQRIVNMKTAAESWKRKARTELDRIDARS